MTDAETAVVEQTLRINARPETVWRYWTDPARMCDWWGAAAEHRAGWSHFLPLLTAAASGAGRPGDETPA